MAKVGREGGHLDSASSPGLSSDSTQRQGTAKGSKGLQMDRHSGLITYGGYILMRSVKLDNCNTDYLARQSRWRHFEKQQLFQRELSQKMNAHFVASLAQEYDPVAIRRPNSPL
ncbi:hypothetical protein, conserved [Babesia bigemina]|uniref:Uncharacterized protein n=1 Tax=Babesia bigemina TaxID=5866 RepID=A0A061D6L2_BABBI|nr:hypothetical protein, conserved [Babesia bigemina]CDR96306.1 hypothetical protein, conserved [Babesia bigemina]|eukprot:XP_012768492.1 hypothetical protein, conserved [Babesia bigemina]